MKLEFKKNYLSITKFNDVELPDFTILTGINGAGKSHLIWGIKSKSVLLNNDENLNIVDFNFSSFLLNNEAPFKLQQIVDERNNAWNFLQGNLRTTVIAFKNGLKENYEIIKNECAEKEISLWQNESPLLLTYKSQIKNIFQQHQNQVFIGALLSLVKKIPYSIDEITREDFDNLYKPFSYTQDFLPTNIGKIFWDYYIKYKENRFEKFENRPALEESDFILIHDEKPWVQMNKVLQEFNHLDYEVNNPEGLKFYEDSFQLQLIHKQNKNLKLPFQSLSSGEKILMALVATIYKASIDNHYPDVLLLDEIDASLHPSMIDNLLNVIRNIFIKNGMKVILVTHSPTTIALSDDKSIFIMNKEGEDRIEKKSKREALKILTNGYVSFTNSESITGISYNIEKNSNLPILFTEGITDKIIIETAWNKLYTEDMPFYVQDCFDASFLRNLITRGNENPNGIFKVYSETKFIALFDFDGEGYSAYNGLKKIFTEEVESNPMNCLTIKHNNHDAYICLLPVPNNEIIKKQVILEGNNTHKENSKLYIEHLFYGIDDCNDFFENKQIPGGSIIEFKSKKTKFANFIKRLDNDKFENFKPLFDKIKSL